MSSSVRFRYLSLFDFVKNIEFRELSGSVVECLT